MGTKIKTSQAKDVPARSKQMVTAIQKKWVFTPPNVGYDLPTSGKSFKLYSLKITADGINKMLAKGKDTLWQSFETEFSETSQAYPRVKPGYV